MNAPNFVFNFENGSAPTFRIDRVLATLDYKFTGENTWNQITEVDFTVSADLRKKTHFARLHLGSTLRGEEAYVALEDWREDPADQTKRKIAAAIILELRSNCAKAVEIVAEMIRVGKADMWLVSPSCDTQVGEPVFRVDISTRAEISSQRVNDVRKYFKDHKDKTGPGAIELKRVFIDSRRDDAAAKVLELP